MRTSICVASLVLAALLCGCSPVVSVRPLYTPVESEKPYLEQRLEGDWVTANTDASTEHGAEPQSSMRASIARSEGAYAAYTVVFHGKDEPSDKQEESTEYDFRLVPLEGHLFFDAVFNERRENAKQLARRDMPDMAAIPGHLLGQVWIEPAFVRVAPLDQDWVTANWPEKEIIAHTGDREAGVIVLTNTTPDLRDLLAQNAHSAAFRFPFYLCRAGADCTKLAVDDQLARTPDDAGAAHEGVTFYAKRGDFPRAVTLQHRLVEIERPENETLASQQQYELAKLLLLNLEFANARGALQGIKVQPSFGRPSPAELVVSSYFLEGSYARTAEAAKAISPEELTTADSIILGYFALQRLGKARDAESFLTEQTAAFRGDTEEHLFLLKLAGRLTSVEWRKDLDRDRYYRALSALQAGKTGEAVPLLQQQIAADSKDSLWRLAAEIELERLSKSNPK